MKKDKNKSTSSWDLSPAPESKGHISLKAKYDLLINGKWVKPSSGKYFDSINPANEEKLAQVAHANEADVDKAVKATRAAYTNVWSKLSGRERGKGEGDRGRGRSAEASRAEGLTGGARNAKAPGRRSLDAPALHANGLSARARSCT